MLPGWLGINYDDLHNSKFKHRCNLSQLIYFLPAHFLDSIYKFHVGTFRFKENYLALVGEKHVNELLNLTCLILSDENIISNPYIGANFLELIFYFLYESKTGIMYQVLKTNTVCLNNLTFELMKFYCDIAVTGSSHQFYEKFKYRQFANRIFMALWVHEPHREKLKSYFNTPVFERFLNMVITDTTYCFDETNEKYGPYKELEGKGEQRKLTK
jgi:hypothetical protein